MTDQILLPVGNINVAYLQEFDLQITTWITNTKICYLECSGTLLYQVDSIRQLLVFAAPDVPLYWDHQPPPTSINIFFTPPAKIALVVIVISIFHTNIRTRQDTVTTHQGQDTTLFSSWKEPFMTLQSLRLCSHWLRVQLLTPPLFHLSCYTQTITPGCNLLNCSGADNSDEKCQKWPRLALLVSHCVVLTFFTCTSSGQIYIRVLI